MERRLAAILAADVVDYTRIMAADQARTLAALRELREHLFGPIVETYRGTVIKSMGDGWLAEFPSITDAVNCAISVQTGLQEHEIIRLRMGIHTGEVAFEAEDVFGDGVNIAARLEALAAPGQILLSDIAYNSLDGATGSQFSGGEPQQLKNVTRPVAVWRWGANTATATSKTSATAGARDKPSIAVLPFDNMSGDPDQEFFSDGVTEDIITALSKFRWFTVTARNSTFAYKGQAVNIRQVGQELNVRYVLEGSVRRSGNRVRVTAQLIEARSEDHVWADRFDGQLDDIFDLQDEITRSIVATVAPEIQEAEMAAAARKESLDLNVWERVMQARWHISKYNRDDMQKAVELLRALNHDAPEVAEAFSLLATCHMYLMLNAWCDDPKMEIVAADDAARAAVSRDDNDAFAQVILGFTALFNRQYQDSLKYLRLATKLNANIAAAYGVLATAYGCMGECENSVAAFETAMSLSPRDPTRLVWMSGIGIGMIIAERYDEAVENCHDMMRLDRNYGPAHRQLCSALALAGRQPEAATAMQELLQAMPELTIARVEKMVPVMNAEDNARWLDGLRQAGLPEWPPGVNIG